MFFLHFYVAIGKCVITERSTFVAHMFLWQGALGEAEGADKLPGGSTQTMVGRHGAYTSHELIFYSFYGKQCIE